MILERFLEENYKNCAASVIIFTKTANYEDKDEELDLVKLRGVVHKNKTYRPKQNYEFELSLKDHGDFKKGDVNNVKDLVKYGQKFNLLVKKGGKIKFGDKEFETLKGVESRLKVSENLRSSLWKHINLFKDI